MTQSMYQDYFGISENPFSIIPDPHYLYMSQRHQEALAHLLYGVGESGGFVLLTGEVGTGKTTISRALMEQLPEKTDLALILNPRLSETELLATICDEMHIPYPLGTVSLKEFFDVLNEHLLKAHAEGRNPVLMIDEAQNLSSEALELVRLLTNLETVDKKLLQIILVGQPELNHTLALVENRQTAQRITARYHLQPLNLMETRGYVRHRLKVAGLDANVFTNRALKAVHKASRGIPRLINSICDRALLAAYVEGRKDIGAKLAKRASAEVQGHVAQPSLKNFLVTFVFAASVTAGLLLVALDPYGWGLKSRISGAGEQAWAWVERTLPHKSQPQPASKADTAPDAVSPGDAPPVDAQPEQHTGQETAEEPLAEPEVEVEPEVVPIAEPEVRDEAVIDTPDEAITAAPPPPPPPSIPSDNERIEISAAQAALIGDVRQAGTPDTAFVQLFKLWHADYLSLNGLTPCDKAASTQLSCRQGTTDLPGLKAMNRPAVVSFTMPDAKRLFGVLSSIAHSGDAETVTIDFGERTVTLTPQVFSQHWPGDYMVMWKQPETISRTLELGQQGVDVFELRRLLAKVGYGKLTALTATQIEAPFDADLKALVETFQKDHGLEPSGSADAETVMRLTGVAGETFGPRIWREED